MNYGTIFRYREDKPRKDGLYWYFCFTRPDTLRALAKFFEIAARELEEMGDDFGNLHLMDHWSGWTEGAPDIQIFNGQI